MILVYTKASYRELSVWAKKFEFQILIAPGSERRATHSFCGNRPFTNRGLDENSQPQRFGSQWHHEMRHEPRVYR
jgi:hypothetical protein